MRAKARSRNVLLPLVVALACSCFAACISPRKFYYAATHKIVRAPTENMLPTIKPGDSAAVNMGYYENNSVERFDMVVFKLPPEDMPDVPGVDEDTTYLKRVVGLGGETLEIRGGRIYVNGRELDEPFETVPLEPTDKFGPVRVPEGEYFLLGDNRPNSADSRFWPKSTLPKRNLLGKVIEIFHE